MGFSDEQLEALHATGAQRFSPIDRGTVIITGENPAVGNIDLETVWTPGGIRPLPTSELQMSAKSTSIDDTFGGSGAEVLTLNYLDSQFREFSVSADLDGNTLVPIGLPNCFRIQPSGVTPQPGTTDRRKNIGTITIENGGTVYDQISLDVDGVGYGGTHSAAFTVPANYTGYAARVFWGTSDDINALIMSSIRLPDGSFMFRSFPVDLRNQQSIVAGSVYPFGSDLEVRAKSGSGVAALTVVIRLILVFNIES